MARGRMSEPNPLAVMMIPMIKRDLNALNLSQNSQIEELNISFPHVHADKIIICARVIMDLEFLNMFWS